MFYAQNEMEKLMFGNASCFTKIIENCVECAFFEN